MCAIFGVKILNIFKIYPENGIENGDFIKILAYKFILSNKKLALTKLIVRGRMFLDKEEVEK